MKQRINYYFVVTVLILVAFGILFLSTLSAIESLEVFGNTNYYLFKQLISIVVGLVAGIAMYKLPLEFLKKISLPLLLGNVVLLIAVFIPGLGAEYWGAQRWIHIGGFTLQPSELLKLTSIMYLASWLSTKFTPSVKKGWTSNAKKGYQDVLKVFLPFLGLLAVVAFFLYTQKDLSTLGVITAALLAVYFAAGTPLWHTLLLGIMGISSALVLILTEPYRIKRFLVFLYPEADPLGMGFQLKQSILAIGSGGWFGRGLGMSTQKFGYLPQAMGDSIFAIMGEELGIIGCTIVVGLLVMFFWQSLKIGTSSNEVFGRLCAIGIATWIITQSFMNISSALGIFPLAGIPLPFFSYGGSHIIAELVAVGLLLNISKNR